ncbi:MAG TPA: glycosyltransferase [Candidatus Cloacimonadota bacterium]|nr:glycosyltransferase [Candidatus Cloacimonadota bacterium]
MIIIYCLAGGYAAILFFFLIGIFLIRKSQPSENQKISVIIAARNEEKNLPGLLTILTQQNYPQENYEIIIADDRSNDATSEIVEKWQKDFLNITLVRVKTENPQLVGKKGAITAAVAAARFSILAFTDADCLPTQNWLKEINKHFDQHTDFVAGYSYLTQKNLFFELLKNLERSAIFAVSSGAIGYNWGVTCTAANLAYRKEIFTKAGGFSGIGHIRSGDDDLMLQKISKYLRSMKFMFSRDSVILSEGSATGRQQINLETRRGSKWKYYPLSIKLITLLVMLFYLSYVYLLGGCIIGAFSWNLFLMITCLKIIPEFLLLFVFLWKMHRFGLLLLLPIAELIYIPYFIFFGLKGTFGKYKWKE